MIVLLYMREPRFYGPVYILKVSVEKMNVTFSVTFKIHFIALEVDNIGIP